MLETEKDIEVLSDLAESDFVDDTQEVSLERAQDAIAFAQSLWTLFGDQLLHSDGDDPDYSKMEHIVDALNGELAAAVLFINSLDIDAESILRKNADLLQKYSADQVEGAQNVPNVVIEGNRRLATRVKNTKVVLAAKRVTRLVPDEKTS